MFADAQRVPRGDWKGGKGEKKGRAALQPTRRFAWQRLVWPPDPMVSAPMALGWVRYFSKGLRGQTGRLRGA